MKLLPALVVGLTAAFLAVQDLKSEKKDPEKVIESPDEVQETPEEKEKQMDEYEEIVNDEYLNITMEDDLSEIMGEDFEEEDEDEEVAEGESIGEITEDEYNIGIFNFDQVRLMYFTEDRILCDDDMVTIGNVDLETQSAEITLKWIRNFNLPYDIRLEIIEDSYSGSR